VLSGNPDLDPLLNEVHLKWGGSLGTGASLTFSFPWSGGLAAYWQTPTYSSLNEPYASQHSAFNSTQMAAARSALQTWANVANLSFSEVAESSTNVGDFRFAFSSAVPSGSWGESAYPSWYRADAADVWVRPYYATTTDWSASSSNFMSLVHEIGHGLGLKHPGNYDAVSGTGTAPFLHSSLDTLQYSVMSYNYPANSLFVRITRDSTGYSWTAFYVTPDTPMLLDIAAMQYLYGANRSYHSGDDVYTFDNRTPFFRTLWDAGGNDTISLSNFTLGCKIDLTPGHFSNVTILSDTSPAGIQWQTAPPTPTYDGVGNLAIAVGCTIENATGGSGNDTLVGNSANNILDGGPGIDTVVYSGRSANYSVNQGVSGCSIRDGTGTDGTDTLANVERVTFADVKLALDMASTQAGGETAVLIGAVLPGLLAFDASKQSILGNAIALFDQGYTLPVLAGALLRLPIWDVLAGGSDNTLVARYLLSNINGAAPDQSTLSAAVSALNSEMSQGVHGDSNWLANLALSAAGQAHVGLVGLAQTGMAFQ
jgi:hypothetical protein